MLTCGKDNSLTVKMWLLLFGLLFLGLLLYILIARGKKQSEQETNTAGKIYCLQEHFPGKYQQGVASYNLYVDSDGHVFQYQNPFFGPAQTKLTMKDVENMLSKERKMLKTLPQSDLAEFRKLTSDALAETGGKSTQLIRKDTQSQYSTVSCLFSAADKNAAPTILYLSTTENDDDSSEKSKKAATALKQWLEENLKES